MRIVAFIFLMIVQVTYATDFKPFEENGKVGLKNSNGQVVLPPAFEALGWSDGSFSVSGEITGYKLKGRWGLINLKKEFITPAEYETLIFSGADRVVAQKRISAISIKTGSLTLLGKVTIPFMYDAIVIHGLRAIVMEKQGVLYQFGLVDLDNKIILPLKFKSLYPVGSLRFAVENDIGKLALFSDTGKALTDFFIDSIGNFHRDHAIAFSNGLQGLLNRDGDLVVAPQYQKIELGEISRALQPSEWKVISPENKELQSLVADAIHPYNDNLYRVVRAGREGLLDRDLKTVWPLVYDAIGPMKNGLTAVKKNGSWGLLASDAKETLPFESDSLIWDGEIALTLSHRTGNDLWSFINVKENLRSGRGYEQLVRINDQYHGIMRQGFFGLLNREGQEKLHCVYDSILEIRNSQVAIKFKGQFGIVSTDEHWLLAPQPHKIRLVNTEHYLEQQLGTTFLKSFSGDIIYFTSNPVAVHSNFLEERLSDGQSKWVNWSGQEIKLSPGVAVRSIDFPSTKHQENYHDGLQLFQGQGKFGFRDTQGRLIIPNRYDSARHFSEGLAPFKLLGKWGYLNVDDKIIVNPTYEIADDFVNGFALVRVKGKYGLIGKHGEVRMTIQYDSIVRQQEKLFIFQNGQTGIASDDGRILVQPRYDHLEILPNELLLAKLNESYGVISADGLSVIPIQYDSLEYDAVKNVFLAHQPPNWITLMGF